MRKKISCTFCLLLMAVAAIAQDSLRLQKNDTKNYYSPSPLITIKGEEFKRFPSGNFLDAVNGLFPWVFSLAPNANDFLYVVNGFLLADINGISLSDIEEVSFSASSLDGNLYPLSKAGTFYITTRKATSKKLAISFNTQLNSMGDKDRTVAAVDPGLITTNTSTSHAGYSIGNHLALMAGEKKWNVYFAAQLDHAVLPENDHTTNRVFTSTMQMDTSLQNLKQRELNIRSLLQLTYKVSPQLNVGITGSYFHGNRNRDIDLSLHYPDLIGRNAASNEKNRLPYYYGGAFVDWKPINKFSNKINFEYATDRVNDHYENAAVAIENNIPRNGNYITETALHNKRLLLRDEMKYTFHSTEKLQAGISTIFSYITQKEDYSYFYSYTNDQTPTSVGGSTNASNQKLTSLNPSLFFSYNNLLSGYAGYAILLNKYLSKYSAASRQNPYGGFTLNLKNIVPTGNKINRFDFSFDYGNLTRNDATSNWLPGIDVPVQPNSITGSSQYFGSIVNAFPNPTLINTLLKNRLVSLLINASLYNSRLSVGGGWRELRAENIYYETLDFGGGSTFILANKNTAINQGMQLYVAAKLIDQPFKTWGIRLNLLSMTKTRYKFNYDFMAKIPSLQDQLEVGLQNHISIKNWFIQLNGLMALNKKTVTTFLLNYLVVGYEFAETNNQFLKKTSLFVQARNLVSSGASKNYYGYYSYVGLGANLSF
jgi:hypothetical protein